MPDVTVAQFRTKFPEFASTTDALIADAIYDARLIHNVQTVAILYCAAHLLSVPAVGIGSSTGNQGMIATHGEITRKTVGPLSIDYETFGSSGTNIGGGGSTGRSTEDLNFFARTEYGRRFLIFEGRTSTHTVGTRVIG